MQSRPSPQPASPSSQSGDSAPATAHLGPQSMDDPILHDVFDAHELAIVLSNYDLGIIESIREHSRGSRRAPKLLIKTQHGEYLLKRRAPGKDDPYRVAFTHELQLHLAARGFPLPQIIGTRPDHNSMLLLQDRIYEVFQFIRGKRYDRSEHAAEQSGVSLGALHRLLATYNSEYEAPQGTYHNVRDIDARVALIPDAIMKVDPDADRADLHQMCQVLSESYRQASYQVDAASYRQWPRILIHGDWHPGNLLYDDRVVLAVIDFDSARMETRATDVANAALQFSIQMGATTDCQSWPEGLDLTLLRRLIRGYNQAAATPLSPQEQRALPWLMIEALIVESVIPIATTGRFGALKGVDFLGVISRNVQWIESQAQMVSQPATE